MPRPSTAPRSLPAAPPTRWFRLGTSNIAVTSEAITGPSPVAASGSTGRLFITPPSTSSRSPMRDRRPDPGQAEARPHGLDQQPAAVEVLGGGHQVAARAHELDAAAPRSASVAEHPPHHRLGPPPAHQRDHRQRVVAHRVARARTPRSQRSRIAAGSTPIARCAPTTAPMLTPAMRSKVTPGLQQHLQHADVGEPARAAAREGEAERAALERPGQRAPASAPTPPACRSAAPPGRPSASIQSAQRAAAASCPASSRSQRPSTSGRRHSGAGGPSATSSVRSAWRRQKACHSAPSPALGRQQHLVVLALGAVEQLRVVVGGAGLGLGEHGMLDSPSRPESAAASSRALGLAGTPSSPIVSGSGDGERSRLWLACELGCQVAGERAARSRASLSSRSSMRSAVELQQLAVAPGPDRGRARGAGEQRQLAERRAAAEHAQHLPRGLDDTTSSRPESTTYRASGASPWRNSQSPARTRTRVACDARSSRCVGSSAAKMGAATRASAGGDGSGIEAY